MPSLSNGKRSTARSVVHALLAIAKFYPPATIVIVVITGFTIDLEVSQYRQAVYERSPEGKVAAARQKLEDDQKFAAWEAQSRTETDLAGLKVWLRDPDSARFTSLHHAKVDGKEVTCGMVNSRNGFGGMSGPESFAVVDFAVNLSSMGHKAIKEIDHYCPVPR